MHPITRDGFIFRGCVGLKAVGADVADQPLYCLRLVRVEDAATNPEELPTATLQHALAHHVGLVLVGAVPNIAVALDGQLARPIFDDQIDPLTGDLVSRDDAEARPKQ